MTAPDDRDWLAALPLAMVTVAVTLLVLVFVVNVLVWLV